MPPVALTASTSSALAPSVAGPAGCTPPAEADDRAPSAVTARPAGAQLRLVASTPSDEIEVVHGRGGPASCSCRDCTMARHPAAMFRLSVVR